MRGRIIRGIAGFYYVYSGGETYECKAAGIFRNRKVKPLVGDLVAFDLVSEKERTGQIRSIEERKNTLIRPAVSNVDQLFLLFSAVSPAPNYVELNRYLVTVGELELPVVLVVTKCDLADPETRSSVRKAFLHAPYDMYFVSSLTGEGAEELREALSCRTTVFSGPSGVGKSSLLNLLVGGEVMAVGDLSKKIERGRNTTRHAELFSIGKDSFVLDTPGFTAVDIDRLKPENLALSFGEMIPHLTKCRYPSCAHLKEPDCAVKQAVEAGEISRIRYESYAEMMRYLTQIRRY